MNEYTKKDISEITKLSERQVQFYTEQSVVIPEIDRGEGRGNPRKYSDWNIVQFYVIKSLASLGVTVGRIREIVHLMNHKPVKRSYEIMKERGVDLAYMISQNESGGLVCAWVECSQDEGPERRTVYEGNVFYRDATIVISIPKRD